MGDFHIFRRAIAPFSLYSAVYTRETDGGTIDRVIDPFAPFEGLVLRHIENDRSCSIGVLMAFNDGAAQTPSEFLSALLGT